MGAPLSLPSDPEPPPPLAALHARRIGGFVFDPERRVLTAGAMVHRLAPKVAAVLHRLMQAQGQVVTRDELIAEVWNGNIYTGPRGLTQAIWELRRVLDKTDDPAVPAAAGETSSLIQTISKSGYRLDIAATREDTPAHTNPGASSAPGDTNAPVEATSPPRRRERLFLAAGLVIALAAGAAWLRPAASPPGAMAAAPPIPLTTWDGVEDFPAFSPDGQHWAYTWERARQPARIRIADLRRPAQPPMDVVDADAAATLQRPVWIDAGHLAYMRSSGSTCRVVLFDLRDQRRRDVAQCEVERAMQLMDASPDGRWLAIARSRAGNGRIGIVLHRLADGFERELTQPPPGFGDTEIAWSRDGRRIGFLRTDATVGDLYVVDVDGGAVQRLTHDEAPVWGVAWMPGDRALVLSSTRDGARGIWQVPAQGGAPRLFARIDSTRNLASMSDGSGDIAVSVSRFADQIEVVELSSGRVLGSIASRSREMYGRVCPDAGHVAFVSMRSGSVGLWFVEGSNSEPRPLPVPAGTPEPPVCSPDGKQFATVLRPAGGSRDVIVVGAPAGSPGGSRVYDVGSNFSAVNWSADGKSLIVASDHGEGSDLWRLDLITQRLSRLTSDHGVFGREVEIDGRAWLYYARADLAGLWRRPIGPASATAPAEQVLAELGTEDLGNWQWHDGQLWWVRRDSGGDRLAWRDRDGSDHVALTLPSGTLRTFGAFSLADDGTVLLSVTGPRQADIVRVAAPVR